MPYPAQSSSPISSVLIGIAALLAVFGFFYTTWPGPQLALLGMVPWRNAESINNGKCRRVEGLEACEKIIWHAPSSTLYLACSTRESRFAWTPALDALDSSKRSGKDSIFSYDPATDTIKQIPFTNYPNPGSGISVHGMSIVASADDPDLLWVYMVNHRVPKTGNTAKVGADSTVEVLQMRSGDEEVRWLRTVRNPEVIIAPNDLVGSADGQSFYFTNEYDSKLSLTRVAARLGIRRGAGSVGYCHVKDGCKHAVLNVPGANGIARGKDDLIWIAESFTGTLKAYKEPSPGVLEEVEHISIGRYMDNIAVDPRGDLYVATVPRPADFKHHFDSMGSGRVLSSAHRIGLSEEYAAAVAANTTAEFHGDKDEIEMIFEDDGREANGITSVEYDPATRTLFLHGLVSKHLSVCEI